MPWKVTFAPHQSREERRPVLIPAQIRCGGDEWTDARILNLSSEGMMIRTLDFLPLGSELELRWAGRAAHAVVMWAHGTCAGLKLTMADPKSATAPADTVQAPAPCRHVRFG